MNGRSRPGETGWLPALPAVAVVGLLFGGALVGAARTSLDQTPLQPGGWGLGSWTEVLTDPGLAAAAGFTLATTVVGTIVSVIGGVAVAAALRDRRWARTLATLPVLVPHLLVAVVTVLWLGPGGLADRLLGGLPFDVVRAGSGLGVVLVYVVKEVPFLALLALSAWDDDVAAREEAAAVHGASTWQRLRLVVLPALRPALVIGATIVGAYMLGSFEVPLLVGPSSPDTLATHALQATRTASLQGQSVAAAVLLLTSALSLAVAGVAAWTLRGRRG